MEGRAGGPAPARQSVQEVFHEVGVPRDFLDRYPFELSGGMRQRVALATALVTKPDLIVLDEPTSALDVLTQAGIMNLLKTINWETRTNFVLITHDIAAASEIADDAAVMYAGQLVETSRAEQFYREPLHPNSRALMANVPTLIAEKTPEFIPCRSPSLLHPHARCRC